MPNKCPYFVNDVIGGSCAPRGLGDLIKWRREGVTGVVAVLEDWEMRALGYPLNQYLRDADELGIKVLHVPVRDMRAPSIDEFLSIFKWIDEAIKAGRVIVHCNAGIGRSPTIIIGYLMYRGLSLDESMALVKSINGDAAPSYWQGAALLELSNSLEQRAVKDKNGGK